MRQSQRVKEAKKEIKKVKKNDKNYKNSRRKTVFKILKICFVVVLSICSIILLGVLAYGLIKTQEKYMINYGEVESTSVMDTYIIREEKIIPTDMSKTISTVIAEGMRVAKGDIVAFYKDKEHEESEKRLIQIDKEIFSSIANLPAVYSGDIKNIELKIEELLLSSKTINSYVKLQSNKNQIEELLIEKANILASLSPEGANIKNLLAERDNIEKDINKLGGNIKTDKSGIVTYKIDGLEEDLQLSNIENFDYIKEKVDKKLEVATYGIKIVNNFKAYLYLSSENKEIPNNMAVGNRYKIRLLDQNNEEIIGKVTKINAKETTSEVILEINNGIEKLLNGRKFNCEFVWWEYDGMKVPLTALKKINDIYHVTLIKFGEYVNVPVKVIKENNKFAIIDNYTEEQLTELKLDNENRINMYDEIIINKNK